jgi:hypothetical protein
MLKETVDLLSGIPANVITAAATIGGIVATGAISLITLWISKHFESKQRERIGSKTQNCRFMSHSWKVFPDFMNRKIATLSSIGFCFEIRITLPTTFLH